MKKEEISVGGTYANASENSKCKVVAINGDRITYVNTVTISLEQFAMWADKEVPPGLFQEEA